MNSDSRFSDDPRAADVGDDFGGEDRRCGDLIAWFCDGLVLIISAGLVLLMWELMA